MNYNEEKQNFKQGILNLIGILDEMKTGIDELKELILNIQLAYNITGDEEFSDMLNKTKTAYDKAVDQYNENVLMVNEQIKQYNEM